MYAKKSRYRQYALYHVDSRGFFTTSTIRTMVEYDTGGTVRPAY